MRSMGIARGESRPGADTVDVAHNVAGTRRPRVSPQRGAWAIFGFALIGFPFVGGDFYVNLASQIFIAAVIAECLNLLVGYGGIGSLGHAAGDCLAACKSA